MSDMAYAVHTRTCIYLLDDEGICRWTLAPNGVPTPGADRCVGAQFVACLDLRVEGGLVGELMIGAAALFARVEDGRFVLLRTPMIEYVEFRSEGEEEPAQPEPQTSRQSYPIANPDTDPYPEDVPLYPPPPAYVTAPSRAGSYEEIDLEAEDIEEMVDVEELVTFSEVTLTIPLYRPDAQEAIPLPPRRGMIGPGRRLR
jgi:hypothetical protein